MWHQFCHYYVIFKGTYGSGLTIMKIIYNYSKNLYFIFKRYNIVERYMPDAFKYLLDEIHKLEAELGLLPQKWKVLWDKLEIPVTTDSLKVLYHF